jgi:DNA-binding HxlR family transcriptional regulator
MRGDCFDRACIAHDTLGHVTSRWGVLILGALVPGTLRFAAIRDRVDGISEKMLAQKLREFERDGLIQRTAYPVVPPRVEYTLTVAGRQVAERLCDLIAWLEDHVDELVVARERYVQAQRVAAVAG